MNPFSVTNPEQLDPAAIARDFVDLHTDLPQLRELKNTFILGARGTGKSMLLRSLEPEVMLARDEFGELTQLPWLGVHVPIKKMLFAIPELERLSGYARHAIGEHLLVMQVMVHLAEMLSRLSDNVPERDGEKFKRFVEDLYAASGGQAATREDDDTQANPFANIRGLCERELAAIRQYYVREPFKQEPQVYSGALTGYLDFLLPIAERIRRLPNLPDAPLFLMIDDADNLREHLQRILNSWVGARTTRLICLKISTQLGYKTYRTVDGRVVENPHDFNEVNLSAIYTADEDRYSNRLRGIVGKRLANFGSDAAADDYFPKDVAQAKRLAAISAEIIAEREAGSPMSGASRPRDDVQRYTVPRLMRQLAETKSSHTFSYAGFRSLVDLSSGVVRWFLEPASAMHARMQSESHTDVTEIPVAVQDEVILAWSRDFLKPLQQEPTDDGAGENDNEADASLHAVGHGRESYRRLLNLLNGLGEVYRSRLLDPDASEQRVFSFVLNGIPSRELLDVLGVAVRLGYLQQSDMAVKKGFGARLPRYVLARRLAPHYRLDVSGYAAHLSVQAKDLEVAMTNPRAFAEKRLRKAGGDAMQVTLGLDEPSHG